MNALEQEYQDNLQRVKRREGRRRMIVFALYVVFAFVVAVAYVIRGDFSARSLITGFLLTATYGGPAMFRLARRVFKRFEDRNVEVATTERERGYREPAMVVPEAEAPHARKPGLLALFALVPLGVGAFAIGVAIGDPRDRLIPLGITFTMMGFILVGQRLYGTWRARRNAELELQWEKWLDSADSCEVGPRKWTK